MIFNFDVPQAPSMTLDKLLGSGSIVPNSCSVTGSSYGRTMVCIRKLCCLEVRKGAGSLKKLPSFDTCVSPWTKQEIYSAGLDTSAS